MERVTTTVELLARPKSRQESISWDRWRRRWVVHVREPAVHGEANAALLRALAGWLAVTPGEVRWTRGERTARKVVEVLGLSDEEVRRRLERAAQAGDGGSPSSVG